MRDYAKKFYNGQAWLKCREGYIQSVDGLCEECLRQGIINTGWIVHHKIHLNEGNYNDPNIALNWDNLEYLCQDHHNKIHGKHDSTAEGVRFDDNGQVIKS